MKRGDTPDVLDNPFAIEAIRITKLTNGWNINAFGTTYACESAKSLARQIGLIAAELEASAMGYLQQPIPEQTIEPSPQQVAAWREANEPWIVPEGPSSGEPSPEPLSPDESMDIQRTNLIALIEGLYEGFIDEQTFERGVKESCPNISAEEVEAALNAADAQYNSGVSEAPAVVERRESVVPQMDRATERTNEDAEESEGPNVWVPTDDDGNDVPVPSTEG